MSATPVDSECPICRRGKYFQPKNKKGVPWTINLGVSIDTGEVKGVVPDVEFLQCSVCNNIQFFVAATKFGTSQMAIE